MSDGHVYLNDVFRVWAHSSRKTKVKSENYTALAERLLRDEMERHARRLEAIEKLPRRMTILKAKKGVVQTREDAIARIFELRDEFTEICTHGRFIDAASREWKNLSHKWRMNLIFMSGMGGDVQQVSQLAQRNWREMPPPERETLRSLLREAKADFSKVCALVTKV